jgi:hypothetical protein
LLLFDDERLDEETLIELPNPEMQRKSELVNDMQYYATGSQKESPRLRTGNNSS